MEARRTPEGVRIGGDARQRFHDARGYGRPGEQGTVILTTVEAAHLLHRGDLDAVDGMGFAEFVAAEADGAFAIRFAVFADLRERGFYLDPADREGVPAEYGDREFVVYERGAGRNPSAVAFAVTPTNEHDVQPVDQLGPGVLGVVDEEGEVGYLAVEPTAFEGPVSRPDVSGVDGEIVGDRVFLWAPPPALYREWFFGRPIGGRTATDDPLAISLVEAVYLAEQGTIELSPDRIRSRGRERWGAAFDRRERIYRELRDAGVVPKTGYKFGAEFRVYESFPGIEDMPHSEHLVRVLSPAAELTPAAVSLEVRLAHGVGKRMVFAITTGNPDTATTWLSVSRLTP